MSNLTLNDIISIDVSLSPVITYRRSLNSALFLTTNEALDSKGIVELSSMSDVSTLGLTEGSVEYKTLSLYFAQSPAPPKAFIVSTGYLAGSSIIDKINQARYENYEWYVLIPLSTVTLSQDNLVSLASYIEGISPSSMLALTSKSTTDEVWKFATENTNKYQKTFVQFDSNSLNDGIDSVAGVIGYSLGYNKKLTKSFTLAYKSVTGLTSSDINSEQLKNILNLKANVYVKQGYYYDLFRQGTMLNGDYFDEVFYIDMLVNDLQQNLMSSLISNPKIPATNAGLNILTAVISDTLDNYVDAEFIQSGKWFGADINELKNGDMLSQGYLIMFDDIDAQSSTDRADRIAPNCYICIKLGGAIEHVVLGIRVSR